MDTQQIFNTVYKGLRSQGFQRSFDKSPEGSVRCLYRGPRGRKCAAGHLIPDDKYHVSMENQPCLMSSISTAMGLPHSHQLSEKNYELALFVRELQRIHDTSDLNSTMQRRLEFYAQEQGLTVPQ